MEDIEKEISENLKELGKMINNKNDKKQIQEKREELDKLLKKYLEDFK